jgi:hypothetical protein
MSAKSGSYPKRLLKTSFRAATLRFSLYLTEYMEYRSFRIG